MTFGRVGSLAGAKLLRGGLRSGPVRGRLARAPCLVLEHPLTESTMEWRLGRDLQAALDEECRRWDRDGLVGRLWRKDPGVWTGGDEARWLGWLDLPHAEVPAGALDRFADGVRADGFTDVLLLGMGGSSLGAEVVGHVLGGAPGAPALHVLDTTDPAQIARTASRIDLSRTLCIVSSKSGTTLEPALLAAHFQDRMRQAVGPGRAGAHFVAITDPGSALEETAAAEGFRQVWSGRPDVGGRFSVLSSFGLVPAAASGVDVPAFLAPAREMAERCGPDVPAGRNPGVRLGLLLGLAAAAGRDKTTLALSPSIRVLGGWLEQLLAESTGKAGRGVVPIVDEELGPPAAYGPDRLFVHLRVDDDAEPGQDAALADLAEAGHPVVTLPVPGRAAVAGELFRWELATAACGAVLGVNPFDQPDVEAAKVAARTLTAAWEAGGGFPEEPSAARSDGVALFAGAGTDSRLRASAGDPATLEGLVSAHLASAGVRRLRGAAGLRGSEPGQRRGPAAHPSAGAGRPPGGDERRVRAALSPLDRAGVQGGGGDGRVRAADDRPRRRSAGAGPILHVRGGPDGAGAGRLRGAGRARAPRRPPAPGGRRRRRARARGLAVRARDGGMSVPRGPGVRAEERRGLLEGGWAPGGYRVS